MFENYSVCFLVCIQSMTPEIDLGWFVYRAAPFHVQ